MGKCTMLINALSLIAETVLSNLTDYALSELRLRQQRTYAFKNAFGKAIYRYSSSSAARISMGKPLLSDSTPFSDPTIAAEIAKVLIIGDTPNYVVIGEKWKSTVGREHKWRDFTSESKQLLNYFREELHNTEFFRAEFDSQSLNEISSNLLSGQKSLQEIQSELLSLFELIDTGFGKLTRSFASPPNLISANIRDFTSLIQEKTQGFIGRKFLFDAVESFFIDHSRGYVVVRGDPGIGKTAFAAELVRRHGFLHHFNIRAMGINTASAYLSNICSQLISLYGLEYASLPEQTVQDGGFISQLLFEVSHQLQTDNRCVIVIDGLDEVERLGLPTGINPLYLSPILPPRTYIVLTTRQIVLPRIDCEQKIVDLEHDSVGNIADIREYLIGHFQRPEIQSYIQRQKIDEAQFLDVMQDKSEGNFMYLRYVLPEIVRGAYESLALEEVPNGLENYYEDHWQRMRGLNEQDWFDYKLPVILALTVAKEPISIELLGDYSGIYQLPRIRNVLTDWAQFLHTEEVEYEGQKQKRYRIYHASFQDFISRKEDVLDERVSRQQASKRIADSLLRDWEKG